MQTTNALIQEIRAQAEGIGCCLHITPVVNNPLYTSYAVIPDHPEAKRRHEHMGMFDGVAVIIANADADKVRSNTRFFAKLTSLKERLTRASKIMALLSAQLQNEPRQSTPAEENAAYEAALRKVKELLEARTTPHLHS